MTDTKTTDETLVIDIETHPAEEIDIVEFVIAEEITQAILGGFSEDQARELVNGNAANLLVLVEAVLLELDERKTRERAKGKIDIEAVVDDLELGDLKLLEATTGQKLGKILREFETRDFGADTIAGIVLVALRRDNPEATIEDADKIKLAAIAGDEEGEEADPR